MEQKNVPNRLIPELNLACRIGQKVSDGFNRKTADPIAEFAISLGINGIEMRYTLGGGEFEFDDGDAVVTGPQIGLTSRLLNIMASHAGEAIDPGKLSIALAKNEQPDNEELFGENEEIQQLVSAWMCFTPNEKRPMPFGYDWLAYAIGPIALKTVAEYNKASKLAEIVLNGSRWDERVYETAKSLLVACINYTAVFYADQDEFCNLGYVLNLLPLVQRDNQMQTRSPFDIIMCGTTKEDRFQGFGEWVESMKQTDGFHFAKWGYRASIAAEKSYEAFGCKPYDLQVLAAKTVLLRIAKANLDDDEKRIFWKELSDFRYGDMYDRDGSTV